MSQSASSATGQQQAKQQREFKRDLKVNEKDKTIETVRFVRVNPTKEMAEDNVFEAVDEKGHSSRIADCFAVRNCVCGTLRPGFVGVKKYTKNQLSKWVACDEEPAKKSEADVKLDEDNSLRVIRIHGGSEGDGTIKVLVEQAWNGGEWFVAFVVARGYIYQWQHIYRGQPCGCKVVFDQGKWPLPQHATAPQTDYSRFLLPLSLPAASAATTSAETTSVSPPAAAVLQQPLQQPVQAAPTQTAPVSAAAVQQSVQQSVQQPVQQPLAIAPSTFPQSVLTALNGSAAIDVRYQHQQLGCCQIGKIPKVVEIEHPEGKAFEAKGQVAFYFAEAKQLASVDVNLVADSLLLSFRPPRLTSPSSNPVFWSFVGLTLLQMKRRRS